MRIKTSKYSEMHVVNQGPNVPPHIFVQDKLRTTLHGNLFHSLLIALAPASIPLVSKGEIAAYDVVNYALELVEVAYGASAHNRLLTMSVPPENTINKVLKRG